MQTLRSRSSHAASGPLLRICRRLLALPLDLPIVIAHEPTNDFDVGSAVSVADTLFERTRQGYPPLRYA